jgi:hypothetical protein
MSSEFAGRSTCQSETQSHARNTRKAVGFGGPESTRLAVANRVSASRARQRPVALLPARRDRLR